jgi:hypothetical protein
METNICKDAQWLQFVFGCFASNRFYNNNNYPIRCSSHLFFTFSKIRYTRIMGHSAPRHNFDLLVDIQE